MKILMFYLQKLYVYRNSSFQEMRDKEIKTAWKCDFFGFGAICIIADHRKQLGRNASFSDAASHSATFTELKTTLQVFLFFMIMQMVPNLKTQQMYIFSLFRNLYCYIFWWKYVCQDFFGHRSVNYISGESFNELWIKKLFISKKAQLSLSHHYCLWFSWWPILIYCWCFSWSRQH